MENRNHDAAPSMRLDKWLWVARFFKTRSLAAQAIEGGKVHWQGMRTKPARLVRIGDRLEITIGDMRWTIIVKGLIDARRPAAEARGLYEETEESRARRQEALIARKMAPAPSAKGRPTKRDRRMIRRFTGA
ncbi:MAG: S4 domain-containing protein [Rhodocyclaceae bacterium]|nr:S4 domain-containing protein [Rhodocyclaceae bacterium]